MSIESQPSKLTMFGVNRASSVVKWARTAAYTSDTMEVFEQVVLVDTDTVDGTFTVTLPPVAEAAGKFYSITLIDDGGNLTVQDQDDSIGYAGDFVFDADAEALLLYSDGLAWWVVVNVGSVAVGQ